jgi:hypothetical protein
MGIFLVPYVMSKIDRNDKASGTGTSRQKLKNQDAMVNVVTHKIRSNESAMASNERDC